MLVRAEGVQLVPRKVVPRAGGDQAREKILDSAERLFAGAGFDGVSVRQVGADAEVPFALVTYHFESKLGLYKAVFARRSLLLTTERIDRLRAIRLGKRPRQNFLAIARSLVEPLIEINASAEGRVFSRLLSREINDPVEGGRGIVEQYFDPVAAVTVDTLHQAAPQADLAKVHWAYIFAVGALANANAGTGRVERISGGLCDSNNLASLVEELTNFIAAGFAGALGTARPTESSRQAASPQSPAN
jgi:AcrR family transcriptional regulator